MKKIISVFIAALTVALCLVPTLSVTVSAAKAESAVLNVYNWGEYISDGTEGSLDVNKKFEKYYKETYGVELTVNYATYASNEDLYAKLKSGAVNYDVVIPSDYMIQLMIQEGMLEKLDFSNIPNYVNIDEKYKNQYFDPANEYSVPYNVGMVGIIYDSTVIEGTPDSWSLMWDELYWGKILNFNNPRDAFGTAMYYLGIDVNTTDYAEWDAAFEKLKEEKPIVQGWVMDEIFNKMENGSAAVAPYYAGDFLTMYGENDKLAFYYPKEGTNMFIDSICIPKGAANKLIAERYINFLLSEEIAIANAEMICYASPNKLVFNNQEYLDYMTDIHEDAVAILYPELEADYRSSYYHNLPVETLAYMNSKWEELKISGGFSTGLYVVIIVFVVVDASAFIFLGIRKKKRERFLDEN